MSRKALGLLLVALVLSGCGRKPAAPPLPVAPAAPRGDEANAVAGLLANGQSVEGLACFKCHDLKHPRRALVRFNHSQHNGYGLHCGFCHGPQDHQPKPAGTPRHTWSVSKVCAQCHNGQRAPSGCPTCHINPGDILLVLGDVERGIALVKAEALQEFAKKILETPINPKDD